jgi:uncharacterized protein (UPF0276 family)
MITIRRPTVIKKRPTSRPGCAALAAIRHGNELNVGCFNLAHINSSSCQTFQLRRRSAGYVRGVPAKRVYPFHLAVTRMTKVMIDTHDHPVADPVCSLCIKATQG